MTPALFPSSLGLGWRGQQRVRVYDPLLLLALGQPLYLPPLSPQFHCGHRTLFQRKRDRLVWQGGSWPRVPTPQRSLMSFNFSEVCCWLENVARDNTQTSPESTEKTQYVWSTSSTKVPTCGPVWHADMAEVSLLLG